MLAQINANLVALGMREKAKQPKPYPRPWADTRGDENHYGEGALPSDELRAWFEQKRRERND